MYFFLIFCLWCFVFLLNFLGKSKQKSILNRGYIYLANIFIKLHWYCGHITSLCSLAVFKQFESTKKAAKPRWQAGSLGERRLRQLHRSFLWLCHYVHSPSNSLKNCLNRQATQATISPVIFNPDWFHIFSCALHQLHAFAWSLNWFAEVIRVLFG